MRPVNFLICVCGWFLGVISTAKSQDGCSINTRYDLPKDKQPLYLSKYNGFLSLAQPQLIVNKSMIVVPTGDSLILACPGKDNRLIDGSQQMSNVICGQSKDLKLNGQHLRLKTAVCKKTVKPSLSQTKRSCGYHNEGQMVEVGFEVNGNPNWLKVFDVCHDKQKANTLYTKHTVTHLIQAGSDRNSARPSFKKEGFYGGIPVDKFYKKSYQKVMLHNMLHSDRYFEPKDTFLSRGHLTPDGDFVYTNQQHSTYFYINAAPQWSSFNGGNWLTLERSIKYLATKLGRDLEVTTGTHGVLELPNSKDHPTPLYMDDQEGRVPVPKFFWKTVMDPLTRSGIAILGSNNPFDEPNQPPCPENGCSKYGWNIFDKDIKEGLMYCCTMYELRSTVPNAPYETVHSVLQLDDGYQFRAAWTEDKRVKEDIEDD